jgi:hypothetical protein
VASLAMAMLEETAGTEPWCCILMDKDVINWRKAPNLTVTGWGTWRRWRSCQHGRALPRPPCVDAGRRVRRRVANVLASDARASCGRRPI